MSIAIIVQARMSSTRLPGKVLQQVLNRPLLQFQLERLSRVRNADTIIVATTTSQRDAPIVALCAAMKVDIFRGSEPDVLDRYYHAASDANADAIVRVTADCPLIDPEVVDDIIKTFLSPETKFDYVSNTLVRTYPRGLDCEVFSFAALSETFNGASETYEREHVTPYMYRHPEKYRVGQVKADNDFSKYRWTVDTPDDFELISRMLKTLYPRNPNFGLTDCVKLMETHPEWEQINVQVEQKLVTE